MIIDSCRLLKIILSYRLLYRDYQVGFIAKTAPKKKRNVQPHQPAIGSYCGKPAIKPEGQTLDWGPKSFKSFGCVWKWAMPWYAPKFAKLFLENQQVNHWIQWYQSGWRWFSYIIPWFFSDKAIWASTTKLKRVSQTHGWVHNPKNNR